MKINFTIDATVKEVNTMICPTMLELPEALLGKIVAAVREADRLLTVKEEQKGEENAEGDMDQGQATRPGEADGHGVPCPQ